ncbi:hypothetical protein PAXRUDRAFT_146241, partial [Paxillus rubicundulus Ve08.2h10]
LIDSGCMGSSIDSGFMQAKGFNFQPLPCPIPVYNADETLNQGGMVMHHVMLCMTIRHHSEWITFGVTDLGKGKLFLGHEWLKNHNPSINWQMGSAKFDQCPKYSQQSYQIYEPEEERKTPKWSSGSLTELWKMAREFFLSTFTITKP